MSKFLASRLLEGGLIAAGTIFVIIITIIAHSPDQSYSVGGFDTWQLRPSFDPMDPAEVEARDAKSIECSRACLGGITGSHKLRIRAPPRSQQRHFVIVG